MLALETQSECSCQRRTEPQRTQMVQGCDLATHDGVEPHRVGGIDEAVADKQTCLYLLSHFKLSFERPVDAFIVLLAARWGAMR